MKVEINGPGKVCIRSVDAEGKVLMDRTLTVSGSTAIYAFADIPLELETRKGSIAVIPVLVATASDTPLVKFNEMDHREFSLQRCAEIGASPEAVTVAEAGNGPSVNPDGLDDIEAAIAARINAATSC